MTATYDDPVIYDTSLLTYDGERADIDGAGKPPQSRKIDRPAPGVKAIRPSPSARPARRPNPSGESR